jgi:hypothetical protein
MQSKYVNALCKILDVTQELMSCQSSADSYRINRYLAAGLQ